MLSRETMKGIYILVPTPFTKSGEFDEEAFRNNIKTLANYEISGIATTGTLGEFHSIPWDDHKRLIKALVEECSATKLFSIAGCSAVNTDETIKKTKYAEESGVDAAMNTVPFYTPLTKDECIQYWYDLAEACPDIGLVVYNNPETTNFLVDADMFRELANIPNICGSKEIVGYTPKATFVHWMSIVETTDLAHFACDPITVPAMLCNAKGITSENFALWPQLFLDVYEACEAKDWEKAKNLHYKQMRFVNDVHEAFGKDRYNWFCVLKAALDKLGVIKGGYPHRPYIPVPEEIQEKAKETVLEKYGNELD